LWRVPVMDGEFVVEDRCGVRKGVAGGNFLILGRTPEATLAAAERAVAAIDAVPGVILPFPGGIVRSGSKVGSKYKKLVASTNSPYCPTLRRSIETALPAGGEAVYEIVIDGLSIEAGERATSVGVRAACGDGRVRGGGGGASPRPPGGRGHATRPPPGARTGRPPRRGRDEWRGADHRGSGRGLRRAGDDRRPAAHPRRRRRPPRGAAPRQRARD